MQQYLHPLALDGVWRLVAGILLGTAFGFMIVKSEMAWRKTLVDQLFLRDSRFVRTFLVAISVGSLLFWFLHRHGLVNYNFRPVYFWGAAGGGLITALGIALCGQVPATSVAALASGRFYAVWVFIGILLAFPAVRIVSGWLSRSIYRWPDPFRLPDRLDSLFRGNAVFWFAAAAIILCLFFQFFQVSGGTEDDDN